MRGNPLPPDKNRERGSVGLLGNVGLVSEITRRFSLSLELNVVLSEVLSLTVNSLGADRGSIFLFDQDQRVSRHILARRNLPVEESTKIVSTVLDKGLAGWAVRERQLALVQDTLTDARWHHFPDHESTTRSAIAVPLLHRGELNGVLTLEKREPGGFSQEHLDLAASIAGQAAAVVENARLFTHIRDERAVLQALINGVQQPIIVTDARNQVRYTNPAARALDPKMEQAVGQPVEVVIPSERLAGMFRQLLDSGRRQREEITWADGRTFDTSLDLVPGVGSVAVLHDVTHFKELDRIKSEFVTSVSHDLRAPLTVIVGYVELLRQSLPELDALAVKSLGEIAASVTRMKNLITTLLDLAQIESGLDNAMEPCQVSEIAADVLAEYRAPAEEKEISLHSDVADNLPIIAGHKMRLRQAISNLVGNAVKYSSRGGQVVLMAQIIDNWLVVKVSDTGPGIPVDKQTGLFGKFYRVGAQETFAKEGHGLGLAIVKSVVEAHGGRVWVESAVGQGSAFAFTLPVERGVT
jgi:two-component system phosphate regulon sensor histidine kinase PhoR